MVWYSLTYFVNALGVFATEKNKKIVKIFVIGLLIFLSGTRYYMGGNDVYVYEGTFNNVATVGNVLKYIFTGVGEGVNENYEAGFLLLCSVIKALGFNYFGFILIWTILFYTLMIKGLEEFVPDWSIFFAFFMYKIMFYNTFISIRQGLTMAIFCFALKYLRDRKWYIYFPLAIWAFLEHRGAMVMFPLYFITYMPTSKSFIKAYALLFLPTWFLRGNVVISNILYAISDLIENDNAVDKWATSLEKISIIHTLECYIIVFGIIMLYEKIMSSERKKEAKLVIQLVLMAIPIFTLFSNWIVLTRIKDYFVIMYGVAFGYMLEGGTTTVLIGNKLASVRRRITDPGVVSGKFIAMIALLACFIGMIRYVLVFDGGHLIDYQSIIFKGVGIFN